LWGGRADPSTSSGVYWRLEGGALGPQAQWGRAALARGYAQSVETAEAAETGVSETAEMDWSVLEKLATSDEAKRHVSSLRSTFRDEMAKLEALAPEVRGPARRPDRRPARPRGGGGPCVDALGTRPGG